VLHVGRPQAAPTGARDDLGRYVVRGDLPSEPTAAAVWRARADATDGRVTALATALGLGAPVREGDRWRATRGDAVLVVGTGPGNPWTYSPGGYACPLPTDPATVACGPIPVPQSWAAVDPQVARALATKVLSAADPDGCSPCVPLGGSDRGVQVQYVTTPRIHGAPVSGYVSTVVVARTGVVAANGWLGGRVAGARYPLVTARAALAALASGPQPAIACAAPQPGDQPKDLPLICRSQVVVTGAELGWSLAWDGSRPLLVPSWFFTVDQSTERPQAVAVDPRYLADPSSSGGSGRSGSGSVAPGAGGGTSGSTTGSGGSGGTTGATGSGGSPVPPDAVTTAPEPTVS
jgi:hypothetical protein